VDVPVSFESLRQTLPSVANAKKWDDYYNGVARLDALGVNIPPAVRIVEMVAPYPRMSVDVLAEVLTFIGYTLGENVEDPRLEVLKRVFQVNNMDTQIRMAVVDALVQGAAYFIVGKGLDEGLPRITVHGKSDVAVENDSFGRPAEALVRWRAGDGRNGRRLSHYTPGRIDVYRDSNYGWILDEDASMETGIDEVTVVPMLNKARISDRCGRSEMADVIKLSDAASRTLTGLQIAQELEAMPKRWIFADGVGEAFEKSGKSKLEAYMGYLNFGPGGGSVQQLNGASLDPLINAFKLYAQIISSITGIPPSMLGISTDNPASAEAMRVAKERLTSRGEAKQSMFGDDLEHLGRLVLKASGQATIGLELLETVWRDVATPSKSSQQAMALQAFQAGAISAHTMRDYLDLTPAQRQREDDRELELAGMPRRRVKTDAPIGALDGAGPGLESVPLEGDGGDALSPSG
jgi:hypothetical protein